MALPNEKELDLIKKLRKQVMDLDLSEYQLQDTQLLRWLRARELDLTKAEDMFRKSIEWRKENDIENLLNWKPPTELIKNFPFEIWGFDSEGCPTGMIPFGIWNVRDKVLESGYKKEYLKYIDRLFEFVMLVLQEESKRIKSPITQFNIVVNMKSYQYRQLTSISTVDTILESVRRFEANHPETLKSCIVINAPRVFSILYGMVKPLMSSRTLSKVQIFNSNESTWKAALVKAIPADQIPTRYGGKNNSLNSNIQKIMQDKKLEIILSNDGEDSSDETISDDEETFVGVTVNRGDKLKVEYEVERPGTILKWAFKTKAHDIGFTVLFENKYPVVEFVKVSNPTNGQYLCQKPGTYTFVFDNSYSRMRSKELEYYISYQSPQEFSDINLNMNRLEIIAN